MSVGFRAVQWNRTKLVYDGVLIAAVAFYIAGFAWIYWRVNPPKDLPEAIDIWIRDFGSCAFLMLTVILAIGPRARLDRRFLPLLYNRRHLQPCRRAARRRPPGRRLHRLPLAQLEIPPLHRAGRARLRRRPCAGLSGEGRERPRAGQPRRRQQARQETA